MKFNKALKIFPALVLLASCIFPSAASALDNTGKLNPYVGLSQEEKTKRCTTPVSGKNLEREGKLW